MTRPRTSSRSPLALVPVAAIAAVLLGGCNQDEPAKYLPESGEWTYLPTGVVSNTCDADTTPDPLTTFLLDYDDGDSFDIELGAEDVTCEIDGADFDCSDYITTVDVPGFDITVQWARTWEGEFLSERKAEGNEITRVTCIGTDCNLADNLPCTVNTTFEARAI